MGTKKTIAGCTTGAVVVGIVALPATLAVVGLTAAGPVAGGIFASA